MLDRMKEWKTMNCTTAIFRYFSFFSQFIVVFRFIYMVFTHRFCGEIKSEMKSEDTNKHKQTQTPVSNLEQITAKMKHRI